jgi:hypothetical protein
VISRSSTLRHAGEAVDVRAVGEELGARYAPIPVSPPCWSDWACQQRPAEVQDPEHLGRFEREAR